MILIVVSVYGDKVGDQHFTQLLIGFCTRNIYSPMASDQQYMWGVGSNFNVFLIMQIKFLWTQIEYRKAS